MVDRTRASSLLYWLYVGKRSATFKSRAKQVAENTATIPILALFPTQLCLSSFPQGKEFDIGS